MVNAVLQRRARTGDPRGWLLTPFTPALHPAAMAVHQASLDWALRMGLVASAAHQHKLAAARIGVLVCRGFPDGDVRAIQLCSDWTVLFFILDDQVEKAPTQSAAYALLDTILATARAGPVMDAGEQPLATAMVDLHTRLLELAGVAGLTRFTDALEQLFNAFKQEADHRAQGITPDVARYLRLRQSSIGLSVLFSFFEPIHGVTLPDAVRTHPVLAELSARACNIVGWANDVCTYEKELEEGERHNLVMVLQAGRNLPLDEAVERAVWMHDAEVRAFEQRSRHLPVFGDGMDAAARKYVSMLRAWVRGHMDWAGETGRYRARSQLQAAVG